jgi:hypothetical protein
MPLAQPGDKFKEWFRGSNWPSQEAQQHPGTHGQISDKGERPEVEA